YLALRKRDGQAVAIKMPHDHLLDNEEFAQRFLREGALGSTLHHPNIIRIYEADKLGNQPYIVMEFIDGETLEKKLRRERNLPLHTALEIARDIALALDYARLKGVVHRDLKPDNIMILNRGGLKVMDYGIARIVGSPGLTASEAYLGTPTYSAPEATIGKVDQQSDLYSLGIILYRMIAGDPPFRSTDPLEVLQMHRSMPLPAFPADLEIPSEVARLVKTLTEKSKTDRYKDAESFLIDLNRVLKHL
ncbi:MAG TPA: serine/threonine-protein kinase, partial [Acidobacteriota bacterium]|nr:serine/threonine-protein kinase [Acidobacteriota bacterium]